MDYESLNDVIVDVSETLEETINNLAETFNDIFRELIKSLEDYTERQAKPKYKPVLKLGNTYKQPYLKVRAIARSNI